VCRHNNTLVCSTTRFPDYLLCLSNCECYVPFFAINCLFIYFGFCGSHYNSSMSSVESRLHNVKSQYHCAYWKVQTPEPLEWGAISLTADISGYLEYQLHIKGTVLYFRCSLWCFKFWIWFIIWDLHGSPSAREWCCMYQFKWSLCMKKCSVVFSMMLQSQRW